MLAARRHYPVSALVRQCCSNISYLEKLSNGQPQLDWSYLLDRNNIKEIKENILRRKGVGNIDQVHTIYEEYAKDQDEWCFEKLIEAALLIPNKTSPDAPRGSEPRIVRMPERDLNLEASTVSRKSFRELAINQGLLRFGNLSTSNLVFGNRSYFLIGDLARLERSLVRWTIDKLISKGWSYVTVPDLLPESLIQSCGFVTTGKQNQIFKASKDQGDLCLAGTSEMSMAALYAGRKMPSDKPIKLCTYSPCYRAEEAKNRIDKDFYRLHQFTKVEMFAICTPDQSEALHMEVLKIEDELFSELGLCYCILEMPSEELGASAYRKFDIEAWMFKKEHWGEISSTSNCTDYQSRRLGIMTADGTTHAHTINGTGCAVPRMLIAIAEQYQKSNRMISIPSALKPYMDKEVLQPEARHKSLKFTFSRPRQKLLEKD